MTETILEKKLIWCPFSLARTHPLTWRRPDLRHGVWVECGLMLHFREVTRHQQVREMDETTLGKKTDKRKRKRWRREDASNWSCDHTALQQQPSPISPSFPPHLLVALLMSPTSTTPPPFFPFFLPKKKQKWKMREDGRKTMLSWYNYSISISSHPSPSPSFIILSLSIIPRSFTPPPPPPLSSPLCGCLFRLGWDKWERVNTLGAWGSRRAECGGAGRGEGRQRGNLNSPRLARKENNTPPMMTCNEWQSLWMVLRTDQQAEITGRNGRQGAAMGWQRGRNAVGGEGEWWQRPVSIGRV